MLRARREGLLLSLLWLVTVLAPPGAAAEEPPVDESPAETEEPPVDEPPKEGNDDEWLTPDVAAEEEPTEDAEADQGDGDEGDSEEDVDEVIIEYDREEGEGDRVTDASGKEIEDIPVPVVSKAVEVQDPDDLEPGADKETGVQGQVVSRRPKKVLPDAPVLAKGDDDGRLRSTLTDDRGRYRLYLPPGKYTLRSYYDLYHGARWDNILVSRGAFRRVNFVLDPISEEDAGVEEQEVIYQADTSSEAAQLNIRKETVGVQDAISSEEIKRSGDSTATGAVKRVVGVTIDEDGRIIIRGLADRYNLTLLNGVPVPGVDPSVPGVKLDIFPTDIVSNLSVVKVPRPDLFGAFAGGVLLIDTNKYPRDLTIKAGGSVGFNSMSAFQQMPTYDGGKRDWLGYDDGTRALPSLVGNNRLDVGRAGSGSRYQTRDQVSQVGRSFENVWNPSYRRAIPNLSVKASVGDSGQIGEQGRRAGYLVSFLYDYEEAVRTGFNKRYRFNADGDITATLQDFDIQAGKQEVLWGTFGSAFLELDSENFLNLTTMFSRTSENVTLTQLGFREDTGFENEFLLSKNSYNFIGRSILFNQLTGDHQNLGETQARFQWNLSGGLGRQDEPDRREIQQFPDSQLVTNANRYFSELNQYFVQGKSSVRFPLYQAFDTTAYLSFGAYGGYQDRDFTARRFIQQRLGASLVGDPQVLFDGLNLGTISAVRETTSVDDSYVASNRLLASYAQLETAIAPWLKFLGLVRYEGFTQRVRSESPFAEAVNPDEIKSTDRTDHNPLPSGTFRFEINPEMFVILGYGMTVIRPAIRELAPFNYVDFVRGWNVVGNPDLKSTQVQNAEARYEFYFGGGTDLIAATAFFKWFDDPIEFVINSQINNTATYENAENAWLVGGEIELRLGFKNFHEKLDRLFFVGNVAVMKSQVQLPEGQGISGRLQRQLFNQSPYVTNLSLRFDDPDAGFMVGLVYNAFGPRIVEAGSAAGNFIIPDVFELPQHLLDFIATWQPTPHVKLGLKWKNIAFARKRYEQGGSLVLEEDYGTTVSIGAEYIY